MKPNLTQKFYYISWPECQRLIDIDPDGDHWSWAQDEAGIFAVCEWVDSL